MKHVKSSNLCKVLALLVQMFSAVILGMGVYIIGVYWDYDDLGAGLLKTEYEETRNFEERADEQFLDIYHLVSYRKNFETDGEFDENRIVDIDEYYRTGKISNTSTKSLGYTIRELVDWRQSGFNWTVDYGTEEGASENYSEYEETQTDVVINGETHTITYRESGEEQTVSFFIDEKYESVNGISLYDYILKAGKDPQDFLVEMSEVMDTLMSEISIYNRLVPQHQIDNTNIRYMFYDYTTDKIYTNLEVDEDNPDTVKELVMESGVYAWINSRKLDYKSNVFSVDSALWSFRDAIRNSGCYNAAVGIDTEYHVKDIFYKDKQNFTQVISWTGILIRLSLVALIGGLVSFIYLSFAAGHSRYKEGIKLCFFDKIKTEIPLIVLPLCGLAVCAGIVENVYFGNMGVVSLGISGLLCLSLDAVFMLGYLSLVRRIKAKTLWKNSICYMCVHGIKYVFKNFKYTTKVIALYVIYLVVCLILVLLWASGGDVLAFFGLLGVSIAVGVAIIWDAVSRKKIMEGTKIIGEGNLEYQIPAKTLFGDNEELALVINHIGEGLHKAVDQSIKNERLKTDLITNVSHDIKTPLTSIINYVDLLKREDIQDEKILGYIQILDNKSQRLKHLTEDLVEASKISSGNITLHMEKINFTELIRQTSGEFCERMEAKGLQPILHLPESEIYIMADGRRIWRVIENLYNNVLKYAMENTRVYVDLIPIGNDICFFIKNISAQPLNIKAEELTERFIRGDVSRSTEGSGLGLSIANDLTKMQGGQFQIYVDGDLFKVMVTFPVVEK